MSTYTEPTSWNDKGMDWNNPQPGKADYIFALRNAISERFDRFPEYFSAVPGGQLHYNSIQAIRNMYFWSQGQIGGFIDPDYNNYTSDFYSPYYLTLENLFMKEGCNFSILPPRGAPTVLFKPFFTAIKNALNIFYLQHSRGIGYSATGNGGSYESVPTAILNALNSITETYRDPTYWENSRYIASYSATRSYIPSSGSEYQIQHIAVIEDFRLKGIEWRLHGASNNIHDSNIFLYVIAAKVGTFTSETYEENIFDSNGTFEEGLNIINIGKESDGINQYIFPEFIPENTTMPAEGEKTVRGFEAQVFIAQDYNIEGGYRFRKGD